MARFFKGFTSVRGPVVELSPGTRALGRSMGPAKTCSSPVNAFLGLPYAAPPVGSLRFAPPKPIKLWSGDRDATNFGAVSPQDMRMWAMYPGKAKIKTPTNISEDCLFLNVWTPVLKSYTKKPVMVFIHGGGFLGGYSDLYYGTSLVGLGDVVLVTINYRLNVFGFMTTADDVIPGNYGILDQIEALKWVKRNISAFGGDPDNVTIFGQSAGSVSVSALLFTRQSKGLFDRAICQSGTIQAPWALRTSSIAFQANKHFLTTLGCPSTRSDEILAFLRNVSVDEIMKADKSMCIFAPVVDGDVFKEEDLTADSKTVHPEVDVIIGANNNEGCMFAHMFTNFSFPDKESVCTALDVLLGPTYQEQKAAATSELVQEYLDANLTDEGRLKAFVKKLADWFFIYGTVRATGKQAESSGRTYLYWFQYRDPDTDYPDWVKADHGAELPILFGHRLMKDEMSEQLDGLEKFKNSKESEEMSRKVISLWTNFARSGNPNGDGLPEWPQYTTETGGKHLIIDSAFSTGQDTMLDKAEFWDKFMAKFPKTPTKYSY